MCVGIGRRYECHMENIMFYVLRFLVLPDHNIYSLHTNDICSSECTENIVKTSNICNVPSTLRT